MPVPYRRAPFRRWPHRSRGRQRCVRWCIGCGSLIVSGELSGLGDDLGFLSQFERALLAGSDLARIVHDAAGGRSTRNEPHAYGVTICRFLHDLQNLRTARQFSAFPQTRDSLIFAQIQELFTNANRIVPIWSLEARYSELKSYGWLEPLSRLVRIGESAKSQILAYL
jgi:hypothetical protein